MIMGTLQYAPRYSGLGSGVQSALEFLISQDLTQLSPNRYAIDGDRVFSIVEEISTVPHSARLFEAHRNYIDLHMTLSGEEWYGYAPINNMKQVKEYNPEEDTRLYGGEGVYFRVPDGQFVLFFPEDSHKPGITFDVPGIIRKVIVKIGIEPDKRENA
ncbi:MAG: YhcH/YjgK/YiaL family protein [Synergistaceae bacterium]|jgi:YhcH/YjgK/YiaL family protein|nr:YhcH/YjgK/YiaL family protein [Synergistaceae bacterium]